jgi:hypothetical protein
MVNTHVKGSVAERVFVCVHLQLRCQYRMRQG